ncbi:Cell wall alpha-1,3-glucan synthase ags1 [Rhizophlyctis rosea]|nr:Cell wall alpha-1,3-glucan synthase ags1 [Rhizophlyctis rosea]
MDRFADGDPMNNDPSNDGLLSTDPYEINFRFGGDVRGFINKLDYLQALGVRNILLLGTPFANMPWDYHGYNPIDLTLLDTHFGTLDEWRELMQEGHRRGLYFTADLTVSTLADWVGYEGYVNVSTPFTMDPYRAIYKTPYSYADFNISGEWDYNCQIPRFWGLDGFPQIVPPQIRPGCFNNDFVTNGDSESMADFAPYQRSLTKFAGVQDRVRDWSDSVAAKVINMVCLLIRALDFDSIRVDKATQFSIKFLTQFVPQIKECAAALGKRNFWVSGELTTTAQHTAVYTGRGRQPNHYPPNSDIAWTAAANATAGSTYLLRPANHYAIDSTAFHYRLYHSLLYVLQVDGNVDINPVDLFNSLPIWDDLYNPQTGRLDLRHMYGITNQDLFRFPALDHGIEKSRLANWLVTVMMTGTANLYYGEEQNFAMLDSMTDDYIYGRQAFSPSLAWGMHGCFAQQPTAFNKDLPFNQERSRNGCRDPIVSGDHFNYTHPSFVFYRHLYWVRTTYGVLRDGMNVQRLGQRTTPYQLPGNGDWPTDVGLWMVTKTFRSNQPELTEPHGPSNTVVIMYSNLNRTNTWTESCSSSTAMVLPFTGTITSIRNLFAPFDTINVQQTPSGQLCVPSLMFPAWGFAAYVPATEWRTPPAALVATTPAHDARLTFTPNSVVDLQLVFSHAMNCSSVQNAFTFVSSADILPRLGSVSCTNLATPLRADDYPGTIPGVWALNTQLIGVREGVHQVLVGSAATADGSMTNTTFKFQFLYGQPNNPIVFPLTNNFSDTLASSFDTDGRIILKHSAYGASRLRVSKDLGLTFSQWESYHDETYVAADGGKDNTVVVEYWSNMTGSAAYRVYSGIDRHGQPVPASNLKRFPSLKVYGDFNQWGHDEFIENEMTYKADGRWEFPFMAQFPTEIILDLFGDNRYQYGDADRDGVLDRLPPAIAPQMNHIKIKAPPFGYQGWTVVVDDRTHQWRLEPRSPLWGIYFLMAILILLPILTALAATWWYRLAFYALVFNTKGRKHGSDGGTFLASKPRLQKLVEKHVHGVDVAAANGRAAQRVLFGTLEYEIPSWKVKVRIGGLGVMAGLMMNHFPELELFWVIPKVGGDIEYGEGGEPEDPIEVTILGRSYLVGVELLEVNRLTYVLLDAPIFRSRTSQEPYPPRMDDLPSAVFYSAWNQCIAECIRRYKPDVYHINDFHGALAPLYLLPQTIPVLLSLHNAEFQGLWPLRTMREKREICSAFNISVSACDKYVTFGNTFNLLNGAASYIRLNQGGIGAVGVSDLYGERAHYRYGALWGLKFIGGLANPNPADVGEADRTDVVESPEQRRAEKLKLKREAQAWAGLKMDSDATLLVFIGRWSEQKGIDLIADLAPSLLEKHPNVQLLCAGPIIDMYGQLAAIKLEQLVEMYPERVYSRPLFTKIPECVFAGCDFVLIPSRDEPFGLVAVEFGRKGALGIGALVGGLGTMPGWWYPVESSEIRHLHGQFSRALDAALLSTEEQREALRAVGKEQRFGVEEWATRLHELYTLVKNIHPEDNVYRSFGAMTLPSHSNSMSVAFVPGSEDDPNVVPYDESEVIRPFIRRISAPPLPGLTRGRSLTLRNPAPTYLEMQNRVGSPQVDIIHVHDGKVIDSPKSTINYRTSTEPLIRFASVSERDSVEDSDVSSSASTIAAIPRADFAIMTGLDGTAIDVDGTAKAKLPSGVELQTITKWSDYNVEPILMFTTETSSIAPLFREEMKNLTANNSIEKYCVEDAFKKAAKSFFKEASAEEQTSLRRSWKRMGPRELAIMVGRYKLYSWPVYTIIFAIAQLFAINSFQMVILTGGPQYGDLDFNILGGVFMLGTLFWWRVFRVAPALYVLTWPLVVYAVALFISGLQIVPHPMGTYWTSRVGLWMYLFASSAGFFFLFLNFAEEAGAEMVDWMRRGAIVEGARMLISLLLWYAASGDGWSLSADRFRPILVGISFVLSALMFVCAYIVSQCLPAYYRQLPATIPALFTVLSRRKLVIWFIATETLRNYWLSGPYGRTMHYIWDLAIPPYILVPLVLILTLILWTLLFASMKRESMIHSWFLPIFAAGLGAMRWCQILWATSGVWMGLQSLGAAAPYLGAGVWIWLGVLDALQAVGIGMMLLQTMTRMHIGATLMLAQFLGAAAVLLARKTAPNSLGPGDVFPNVALWSPGTGVGPFALPVFWVVLVLQVITTLGYLAFFRKEQLSKP